MVAQTGLNGSRCLWKKPFKAFFHEGESKKAEVFRGSLPPHPSVDHFMEGLLAILHEKPALPLPAAAFNWQLTWVVLRNACFLRIAGRSLQYGGNRSWHAANRQPSINCQTGLSWRVGRIAKLT